LSTASPPELEVSNLDEVLACVAAGAECHVGTRQNRHQPLRALGQMAFAVLAAVERRLDGARSVTGGQYLLPWEDGAVAHVPIEERPPLASSRAAAGTARRLASA
jgi:glucosyl-3-phosphoglycerate synthase